MACGATLSLKRSLEFDPLHSPNHQRSPKRRRCMPMTLSPTAPPTKQHQCNPSPFAEVVPKLNSDHIAAHLSAEIKRMHRRKQLQYPYPLSASPPPSGPSSPPSAHLLAGADCLPHASSSSTGSSPSHYSVSPNRQKEVPLFTLRQVGLVCERMLKDREDQIREEYDQVLTNKVAEQYESFLKFNHDQLHRRLDERPASYVS